MLLSIVAVIAVFCAVGIWRMFFYSHNQEEITEAEEAEDPFEKGNEYLQSRYGSDISYHQGRILPDERRRHPLFGQYAVSLSFQVEGVLSGCRFRFRHLKIQSHRDDAAVITLFAGYAFRWEDEDFSYKTGILLYSPQFFKITGLNPENRGYRRLYEMRDGSVLYAGREVEAEIAYGLHKLYRSIEQGFSRLFHGQGMCLFSKGDAAEAYIYSPRPLDGGIEQIMQLVESGLKMVKQEMKEA